VGQSGTAAIRTGRLISIIGTDTRGERGYE
jgi:hypothetical protein